MLERKTYESSEPRPCPACNGEVTSVRYEYGVDGISSALYACSHCTLLFAYPAIIPDLAQRQMDSVDDAELFTPMYKQLHERFVLRRELCQVKSILGSGGHSLLDIGCGTGWTADFWQKNGFAVTGLEPSPVRGRIARERYGLRIISAYLEHVEIDTLFSVIILRHVIEHFENPFALVKKAWDLLAPGGLMVIIVPNIDCIGRYVFDTDWTWVLPWHCIFFNPGSIKSFLQRSGMEVVKVYQTPSPLYYPQSYARKFPAQLLSRAISQPGLAPLVFSIPFAVTGVLSGKTDNITVIARK